MALDLYNDTYNTFCQLVEKENAAVFEIGCGPGNITRYLLTQRPDFKITAIDVAPAMVALARENNPEAAFAVMDCREISTLNREFDAIMCGFCMPYLSKEDCAKLLQDCAVLLNPGGIFYFSVIEGNYQNSGYETSSSGLQMYVYYHQEDYLRESLQANDFELVDLIRKMYPQSDAATSTHLIFIVRKK